MYIRVTKSKTISWGPVFGFSLIAFYCLFTVISILLYPEKVSPFDTYLSMLGNTDLNPSGANFYNLAVITAGFGAILFFLAIYIFYKQFNSNFLLTTGLLSGIANGLSVLMSGIFSQTVNYDAHIAWSYAIFLTLIPALLSFSLVFWNKQDMGKYISLYGFLIILIDTFFIFTLLSGNVESGLGSSLEWISVFSYIIWIGLISFDVMLKGYFKN